MTRSARDWCDAGREFLMKDAYSFDIDEASARVAYQKMFVAYLRTFARLGLRALPVAADTGPIGGDLSHEFIILAETGESEVFCHADLLERPAPEADYSADWMLLSRHLHHYMRAVMKSMSRKFSKPKCLPTNR